MEQKIWKISEVNHAVKQVIEGALGPFWMEGEIGRLTVHRSGHVYLDLKDERTQLKAVFWRGANKVRKLELKTGDKVEVFGRLTVYEVRGEYQFSIQTLRTLGLGVLQKKFEEIKKKLELEGLFDKSRKKNIPALPKVIGVVTSPTGAALQDFLNVINRRFPNIWVKIYPAAVQGKGTEKEVAAGIEYFNKKCPVDVIVVTRGGGSIEDLWGFNDEFLARTIAASDIPVISAVGHEIDFTIADFVSDLRVPTPSSAAELVVGCQEELKRQVNDLTKHLTSTLLLYFEKIKRKYESLANSYVFQDPLRIIYEKQQYVDECVQKIEHRAAIKTERIKSRLQSADAKLHALSPKAVLNRGFSILKVRGTGEIIVSPDIKSGTAVNAVLKKGNLDLLVE
ncbi:MAG: exodeoxyribonuclease VII large subunit [Victivallales bacterium]|nr:exodeoxyribonuclease VII large subunit [Victivallales bacterium]MCF7889113.1 exodeoxyribonuclease VII large subunit [Victivallales bacterium]